MPGPPKTPSAIAKAKGNPGKRGTNKREPKGTKGRPEIPDSIVDDAIACAEWDRLCAAATKTNVLTKEDRSIVELAALAYSEYQEARALIKTDGATYETTNTTGGTVIKKHPATELRSDAWRRYLRATLELGFTPAARTRVSDLGDGEDAGGDDFFGSSH